MMTREYENNTKKALLYSIIEYINADEKYKKYVELIEDNSSKVKK